MKDQWRWKKKHKEKNRESDKRPTRKKRRENAFLCKCCWNATTTIAEESIDERRVGNQKGTWNVKKGFGPLAFSFFSCSNDVLWARKRLVFSRLWSAMQPPSSQQPLPSFDQFKSFLGMPAPALTGHYRCPLFWPCPDSAVHGSSHWWHGDA